MDDTWQLPSHSRARYTHPKLLHSKLSFVQVSFVTKGIIAGPKLPYYHRPKLSYRHQPMPKQVDPRPGTHTTQDHPEHDKGPRHRDEDREDLWQRRLVHLVWLTLSLFTIYVSNLFHYLTTFDARIHRIWFQVGLAALLVWFSVFLYLNYYLSWGRKMPLHYHQWSIHAPKAIPIASGAGLVSLFAFMFAFWPIHGLWSPLLFFFWMMGALSVLSLL